jgi:hypothetical protein
VFSKRSMNLLQKFYGNTNQSSAIMQMYKYAAKYKNEVHNECSNKHLTCSISLMNFSSFDFLSLGIKRRKTSYLVDRLHGCAC